MWEKRVEPNSGTAHVAKCFPLGLAARVGCQGWTLGLAARVGRKGWLLGLAPRVGPLGCPLGLAARVGHYRVGHQGWLLISKFNFRQISTPLWVLSVCGVMNYDDPIYLIPLNCHTLPPLRPGRSQRLNHHFAKIFFTVEVSMWSSGDIHNGSPVGGCKTCLSRWSVI